MRVTQVHTRTRTRRRRKSRHDPKARLVIRRASSIRKRPPSASLLIPTHALQFTTLIRRNLLRRAAFLEEEVIEGNADGDGVADVGD